MRHTWSRILVRWPDPQMAVGLPQQRATPGGGSASPPSFGARGDEPPEPGIEPVGRTLGPTNRPARRPRPNTWEAARLSEVRAALGAAQLLLPGLLAGQLLDGRALRVVRVLGARQLAQAVATDGQATAAVLALGAEIDGAHAASMLGVAVFYRDWRRAALAEALLATAFACAGAAAARASGRPAAQTVLRARRDRIAEQLARRLVPGYSTRRANSAERLGGLHA